MEALRGAVVVFDGKGPARPVGEVAVHYAGAHTADDWIVEALAERESKAVVYTSDRALRDRVEAMGHQSRPAGEVLAMLEHHRRRGAA